MKKAFVFMGGVILAWAVFLLMPPAPLRVETQIKWRERAVYLPAKIDTVWRWRTKRISVAPDTVIQTRIRTDTVRFSTAPGPAPVVRTRFKVVRPEFEMRLGCYGRAAADSIDINYKMQEKYVKSLMAGKKHKWKDYVYFGAGALFTAGIIFLVK